MRSFLSTCFIFIGVLSLLWGGVLIYQRNSPKRLSFAYQSYLAEKPVCQANVPPAEIQIKNLNIDLPVYRAKATKNDWETTADGVSYLESSPTPGQRGNSILYGHNWANLLGKLPSIKPGQQITIKYKDGTEKHFIVQSTAEVSPDDTSILRQTNDNRLTIYTCAGFLDSKRFVVVATLQA